MRVLDLGSGTGELTRWLHETLGASETLGIDSSPEMLAEAQPRAGGGLRFELGDIVDFAGDPAHTGRFDLVFSNAALQWVGGHESLYTRITALLAPGGQLATQMPVVGRHPARTILDDLAREQPFERALAGHRHRLFTGEPGWYASLLHALGYGEQQVLVRVYGHLLRDTRGIVEWFRGSALSPYRELLSPQLYGRLVAEYERRLVAVEGDVSPYFLPFPRLFVWGQRA